jgi:hypothetical protein
MPKVKDIQDRVYINPDMQELHDNTADFAEQLTADFLSGVKLENKPITTAGIQYAHGLGSKYNGFFVMNRDNTAIIYTAPSTDDRKFIKFKASANTIATIWVF